MTQKLGDYGNDMKVYALWGFQPLSSEPPTMHLCSIDVCRITDRQLITRMRIVPSMAASSFRAFWLGRCATSVTT